MADFTPTPQQNAIIEAIRNSNSSLAVVARAGAAKTSTLKLAAQDLPPDEPTLALAFNVKIKDELVEELPSFIDVRTMNGLGHRAWGKTVRRKLILDKKKSGRLIDDAIDRVLGRGGETLDKDEMSEVWSGARKLLDAARNSGLVPNDCEPKASKRFATDDDGTWEELASQYDVDLDYEGLMIAVARRALHTSIKEAFAGLIDFTDQIYMPVCFAGTFAKYRTILVDEAQDLSPINHAMIEKSLPFRGGRVIAVGDPLQAIYGFRGAMHGSLDRMIERYGMEEYPLTTTFRCAKAIVAEAQWRATDLRAADWAPEGEVKTIKEAYTDEIFPHRCAIICRNNAPLMAVAFRLIRNGRGITLMGSDLLQGLGRILVKAQPDPTASAEQCLTALSNWLSKETSLLIAAGRDNLVARRHDQHDCLQALFLDGKANNTKEAIDKLNDLANRCGEITLCTGHKSKGLEWDEVFILDRFRIPSPYAKKAAEAGRPEQLEQEKNLLYVMQTRARKRLTYIDEEQLQRT